MSNILMCGNEPLGLLQGNASDISFTPGGGLLSDNVQDAIIELDSKVLYKDEDNPIIKGTLYIDKANGTSTSVGYSAIVIGNEKASTTEGNSKGALYLYGPEDKYAVLAASNNISSNRTLYLPNKAGTVAITDDIPVRTVVKYTGDTNTIVLNLGRFARFGIMFFGGFNGAAGYGALSVESYGGTRCCYTLANSSGISTIDDFTITNDTTNLTITVEGFPKWSNIRCVCYDTEIW